MIENAESGQNHGIDMRRDSFFVLLALSLGLVAGCSQPDDNNEGKDSGLVIITSDGGNGDGSADVLNCETTSEETCNEVDDDCDGVVDEGCACNYKQTTDGVCKVAKIDEKGNCQPPPSYEEDESSCDGQDNDCDGVADDGCTCTYKHKAKGLCAKATISEEKGTCSEPDAYEKKESTCDGKDNDCDGTTDEGCNCVHGETEPCYTGPSGTQGIGTCTAGTRTCEKGTWTTACANEVKPTSEMCDNKDNDCDSETDEWEINEGFEGSDTGWTAFASGRNTPSTSTSSPDARSGSEAGKAEDSDGACGKAAGIAKDFTVGSGANQLTMYLKARTYRDAVIGVALKDSNGIHELWRKRASGTGILWNMNWTKKTFNISQYDRNFKLIIGNVDDTPSCTSVYHRWEVWVDDIKLGVDCP